MKRTTMRRLCDGKMWKAVDAMIKGLYKQSKRKKFIINMSTFGQYDPDTDICTGCAATCTVQQAAGINFINQDCYFDEQSKKIGVNTNDLDKFESAIDSFRRNPNQFGTYYLLEYFKVKTKFHPDILKKTEQLKGLETTNWHERLPEYRKFCNYLKKLDV